MYGSLTLHERVWSPISSLASEYQLSLPNHSKLFIVHCWCLEVGAHRNFETQAIVLCSSSCPGRQARQSGTLKGPAGLILLLT